MHLMKTGARALLLTLAAALLFACAGCGKKAAQPDEYGLAAEKSKLDGTDIGDDLQLVSTGRYAGLFVEDGSDKTVSDVFCIRVKNTGSSDVQYAQRAATSAMNSTSARSRPDRRCRPSSSARRPCPKSPRS